MAAVAIPPCRKPLYSGATLHLKRVPGWAAAVGDVRQVRQLASKVCHGAEEEHPEGATALTPAPALPPACRRGLHCLLRTLRTLPLVLARQQVGQQEVPKVVGLCI